MRRNLFITTMKQCIQYKTIFDIDDKVKSKLIK